ncbi:MAG TPA: protein kinase [Cellvibrio sp.]|nr:protein kinase [Cellvibrio sp.]
MNQSAPPSRELTHIGHYDILDSIGRGGMGLVYLARDTRLDRLVAIKCLRSELFEPLYRERFKREALLLAKLNHPYIVQIYDFIETPEQLGLVMEFVEGQNLQRYLREQIAPFSQRMQWLTQIAQGLAVAHDAGIIHRDLKAENILINKRGEAKISDLGIAKSLDSNLTLTEHVTGSYASMSPEQALGNKLDFRSDLFSFGILAYQLLCGAHPFGDTDNKMQLLQRIISQPPTSPSKHNPDLPAEISDLLGQLLSKDPNKRPANTHWLAAQCEKLSLLVLASAFESDDTPALLHSGESLTSYTTGDHTGGSLSGIRRHYTGSTREHATFDTRFEKAPVTQRMRNYIGQYRVQLSAGCALILLSAGIAYWQFQPKPPRYIAVLPPNINSQEMPGAQQTLIKDAVYDAIQQSALQLDGYYLIPQNEISDFYDDKDSLESVRRATAADELITTQIQCKIESCNITISRLTPQGEHENRLRVQDTRKVDVLTDNYLSVATTVQNNIGRLYSEKLSNILEKIDEQDYATFLSTNTIYRQKGASKNLLDTLDKLQGPTKSLPAVQTLYTDIALDLHNSTKDPAFLHSVEKNVTAVPTKSNEASHLYNIYYLQIAQNNMDDASQSIEKLKQLNISNASIYELQAYKMIAEKNYTEAIKFYSKAIHSKATANNLLLMAKAHWYSGNTATAKNYITESLSLSPDFYKAHTLLGLIALVDGNIDQAIASFQQVYNNMPDEITNMNSLALCHLLQKNYTRAFELFNQAAELAPHDSLYLLNKADAKNLSGESKEAEILYVAALELIKGETVNSSSLRNQAQAYAHLGQFSQALTSLQQLEKMDPQNIETTYTAALVHTLAKNNASAILNTEITLKNGMNNIWFSFSWFDSLCTNQQFPAILEKYGALNRCAPQSL